MLKVAVTGSTGLVGSRITELLLNDFEFTPLLSKDIDITSETQVKSSLDNIEYDVLLHLAAYTNVDKAENIDKELAYKLNVEGTRTLFEHTKQKGKKFVLISTEFVFDGVTPPYDENSQPNPLNFYGKTKVDAENIVKNKGMIVRISSPYRKEFIGKKDIVRTLKSLLEQGKTLHMVTDSSFTPTYIDDIAYALKYLFNNFLPETFHIVGAGSLSPFEAGKAVAQRFNLDESLVKPTTYAEYFKGKALRPQYAEVVSKKNNFYVMKTFEEGLKNI